METSTKSIDVTEGETNVSVPGGGLNISVLSVLVVPGSAAELTVTLPFMFLL
ncbi:MAG: hypothetical protein ACI9SB_002602 [Candidatus Azotimanducaceae bacterium]